MPEILLRSLGFLLQAAVVGLAAAFVLTQFYPGLGASVRGRIGLADAPAAVAAEAGWTGPVSYADAVAQAAPAVVSIYADKIVTQRTLRLVPNPTLQRFTGITLGQPQRRLERAQGSGVIVAPDGYVLTNHHVIAGAEEILVALHDGRVTRARVVGTDRDTDLAVLRIEGASLPALALEPEVPLTVGDVVLAIGNPFGIGQTVTQGIVSGLGRNQLNLSTYEDFIQTDAAINRGNSGGALVNARGQLVGINTAVLSRLLPDAEGISFAIPVATAERVLREIVEHGVVVRGWIGAEYGDAPTMPGALAPNAPRGVALTSVYQGGPADRAGLRPGDVLLEVDGVAIADQYDLRDREAGLQPGATVQVAGLRSGLPFQAELTLGQRPQPQGLG
ncbi:MAG TPA: trypsin-like peptidase domain-containing protein [Xanthomonadaceae bacterium]|nr:trypsin-like peptidase domain-containing protein [Xanthomonadaceae bacterium]